MKSRTTRRFFRRLAVFFAWLVFAFIILLFQFNRSLPDFLVRRLERKLATEVMTFQFEKASFSIFRGVSLYNARVHVKRSIGAPLMRFNELTLDWDFDLSRPVSSWIKSVYGRGVFVAPFLSLPTSSSRSRSCEEVFRLIFSREAWANETRHVLFEDANIFTVNCKSVEFDLSCGDNLLKMDGIRIIPNSIGYMESVEGYLTFDPFKKALHTVLSGTVTPDVFRELTLFLDGEEAVEYYDAITNIEFPFNASGEIYYEVGKDGSEDREDMRVVINGGDFLYRGRPVKRAKLSLQWVVDPDDEEKTNSKLIISPISASFTDGELDGGVVWYDKLEATDVACTSTLPPRSLVTVLDLEEPECLTNFVFSSVVKAEGSGRIYDTRLLKNSYLSGTVKTDSLKVYGVEVENCSSKWSVKSFQDIDFNEIVGTSHGGVVTGAVNIALDPFEGDLKKRKAKDVKGIVDTRLWINEVGSDHFRETFGIKAPPSKNGRISGYARLTSSLDAFDYSSISGEANLSIHDAELLRIPLFAGLTDFLGRNVAGIDLLLMQSDSDISLTATNGLVEIERATLDGNLLSIVSNGRCRLDGTDFPFEGVAQVRFFHSRSLIGKLARLVTLPISKFMEFRIHGPAMAPSWDYIGIIDRIAEATFWPRKDATEVKTDDEKSSDTKKAEK